MGPLGVLIWYTCLLSTSVVNGTKIGGSGGTEEEQTAAAADAGISQL